MENWKLKYKDERSYKEQIADSNERNLIHKTIIDLIKKGKSKEQILDTLMEAYSNSKFADDFKYFIDHHLNRTTPKINENGEIEWTR